MQDITPELLKKYFDGRCSSEEKQKVEKWFNSANENVSEDEVFKGINKKSLKTGIWKEVKPGSTTTTTKRRWFSPLRIAASALITFVTVYFVYQSQIPDNPSQEASETTYRIIKAPRGEKKHFTLDDGTVIHLNSDSEFRVPTRFSDTIRMVHLSGEAYLEVVPETSRPFTVITANSTIRVLGTAFNVRAYADEPMTTVVVSEGSVRFSAVHGNSVVLTSNESGTCTTENGIIHRQKTSAAMQTVWKDNRLVFNNQSLEEIALTLERWFNVQVTINSKTQKYNHFTGSYQNVTLTSLMKDMSRVMQFDYELNENKLTIY